MQLKVLELAFYCKCDMKKVIFFYLEKWWEKKNKKSLCLVQKKMDFPNYVQLNLTTLIFYFKKIAFSVG